MKCEWNGKGHRKQSQVKHEGKVSEYILKTGRGERKGRRLRFLCAGCANMWASEHKPPESIKLVRRLK